MWGIFIRQKLLKQAFLSSWTRKYMLCKEFYHDFSTKMHQLHGASLPDPIKGLCPWTPEFNLPLVSIYPGATPDYMYGQLYMHEVHIPHVQYLG